MGNTTLDLEKISTWRDSVWERSGRGYLSGPASHSVEMETFAVVGKERIKITVEEEEIFSFQQNQEKIDKLVVQRLARGKTV